ncbi:MAG: hypothetical protein R2857_09910 [Vampirovibrionales bacterium]
MGGNTSELPKVTDVLLNSSVATSSISLWVRVVAILGRLKHVMSLNTNSAKGLPQTTQCHG